MMHKYLLATAALGLGALLSMRVAGIIPGADGPTNGNATQTLAMAPISLGNPAAAATLQTRTPTDNSLLDVLLPGGEARTPRPFERNFKVRSGDTLAQLLDRAGADRTQATQIIASLKGVYDPRRIKVGQTLSATYIPATEDALRANLTTPKFAGLSIPLDYANYIEVRANGDAYYAHKVKRELTPTQVAAGAPIENSLFVAGKSQDVPASVMAEMVRIFSWDVDFQRDIRTGDRFEILYEQLLDQSGKVAHNGRVLYAQLTLRGEDKPLYLHVGKDGHEDYYNASGQSARKALMRTPIDGARLSSGFGKRRHPILGYTKMHKGTDFAAPTGTPIYAAGDGTVEVAGRNGAYGKYVRIRHNGEYATAYAHMSKIKPGMHKGKRVKQGQVIGYVGTTGRSTGPHLHYEILRGGRQTNPMRVQMPSGKKLAGAELTRFQQTRKQLDVAFANAGTDAQLASAE